jgi:hypothetical protein
MNKLRRSRAMTIWFLHFVFWRHACMHFSSPVMTLKDDIDTFRRCHIWQSSRVRTSPLQLLVEKLTQLLCTHTHTHTHYNDRILRVLHRANAVKTVTVSLSRVECNSTCLRRPVGVRLSRQRHARVLPLTQIWIINAFYHAYMTPCRPVISGYVKSCCRRNW